MPKNPELGIRLTTSNPELGIRLTTQAMNLMYAFPILQGPEEGVTLWQWEFVSVCVPDFTLGVGLGQGQPWKRLPGMLTGELRKTPRHFPWIIPGRKRSEAFAEKIEELLSTDPELTYWHEKNKTETNRKGLIRGFQGAYKGLERGSQGDGVIKGRKKPRRPLLLF